MIGPLADKLRKTKHFAGLTPKQQKNLLEKGQWRFHSWKDIALSAGLNETHAKAFYNYLSGYAHAGNLSILQIRNAQSSKSQRSLCAATIGVLMISTANMIRSYCKVFPKSESALHQDSDGAALVDIWINVGTTAVEKIQVDWEKEDLGI